jgi:hypothetical protein
MKKQNFVFLFSTLLIFALLFVPEVSGQNISDTANTSKHYVLPEFTLGYVKMKDGNKEFAVMNYNQLTEEMIFEKDGLMLALDSISKIDTVKVDSRLFIPHGKIFYEVLVIGKVSLYMEHKCNLLATGNPSGYGGVTETGASRNVASMSTYRSFKLELPRDYHITDASLYWVNYKGEFFKANTSAQIRKAIPEKSGEIKDYIKLKKLDLGKSTDLVDLIVKCNEFVK